MSIKQIHITLIFTAISIWGYVFFLVGCATKSCCYGTDMQDNEYCSNTNAYVDCQDNQCEHWANCTNTYFQGDSNAQ